MTPRFPRKDVREFVAWAAERGWTATLTKGSHVKLVHPKVPTPYFMSGTPGDTKALTNQRALLLRAEKRAGIVSER